MGVHMGRLYTPENSWLEAFNAVHLVWIVLNEKPEELAYGSEAIEGVSHLHVFPDMGQDEAGRADEAHLRQSIQLE
jgi:hypothetical protein